MFRVWGLGCRVLMDEEPKEKVWMLTGHFSGLSGSGFCFVSWVD